MTTSIASWNINSVRARIGIVEKFLREEAPDILCLQETKVECGLFPKDMFERLGYTHIVTNGQRMHHGVAIVSRMPLTDVRQYDWQANGEARHIGATMPSGVRLDNVYIPAGGDIPDRNLNPKFGQKLDFFGRMTEWSGALGKTPTVLTGDFNVAPLECDVWSHKALLDVVSHTPLEVETLARLQAASNWVDLGRHFIAAPEPLYTWWSYRAKDWEASNRGRRLDHMWVTPDLRDRAVAHRVVQPARSWERPSDHIPLVTEFAFLSDRPSGDAARRAARAIDAMRRGWPVRVCGTDRALDLLAIESASDTALADFAPGSADVLLSGERAVTLKLTNQRPAATPGAVRLAGAAGHIAAALAIADPALDLAHPLKGPFRTVATGGEDAAAAAMTMARHAGLLPAFFVRDTAGDAETWCDASDIAALLDPTRLMIATRARLPVEASESAEIIAFRSPEEASDHVALAIGRRDGNPPVVRLHSECLTGDVLGSLKCDCGPQLHAALHAMADAPWGVLLYLRQEGRGIGLVNKLRAYALQDQGYDTVDANLRLGFPVEARDFAIAARMLDLLHIPRIRLMTNNPEKVARLEKEGVEVVERIPLALPTNPYNEQYLATKRDRTGHQL